ncbi:hypothetical protein TcCL_NonESM00797 [Trypanosoma cruzi]|uniref:RRM domain-containing protein n=2 Tax=Trypanosoma cruzi TaxID=5693 RepID=Q4D2K3_TRYCC|nr:hypothetical protein, conserved [Trypanosoma cruzi]EAN86754.1 hypothetical protein, conserved [Trypanosoma cruzi]RNC49250.1 hypothetical protein TcCL_NonESM00797 [Trypanosoma cruzi]|eukprot:XP_808605.1 hypothetical protein [Trypanosoma cruzi strain CL Brener]
MNIAITAWAIGTIPAKNMAVDVVARLSNLPTSVTEAHIRELIEPFAKVRRVTMPTPVLWLSCPTGRAEVVGDTLEDTKLVYVHLHGTVIDGNRINVSFAKIGDAPRNDNNHSNKVVDRVPRPVDRWDRARRPRSDTDDGWRQGESARLSHRRRHYEDDRHSRRQDRRRSPRRHPSSSASRSSSPSRRHRRYSHSSYSSSSPSVSPRRRHSSSLSQRRRRKRRRSSSRPRHHGRSRSPSWGD